MREPRIGDSAVTRYTVVDPDVAIFGGEVLHAVMATPTVLREMEVAAYELLARYLDVGEVGAGREMHVRHLAPAPVGATVTTTATCVSFDPRSITCTVEIRLAGALVAEGSVTHAVMPARFFVERQSEMRARAGLTPR